MSGWLVTHIPSWLLLVGLVVLVVGSAALVQTFVRRRFPGLTKGEHNAVIQFTYGFIGFVYAFFIGFVVSSMWGQTNSADGNARAEGAVTVQMVQDLNVFEKADSDRIRQSLLTYEQAAIAEWTHAADSRSPGADGGLAGLYASYREVKPESDVQKTSLATSFSNLDKMSQARTERLFTARQDTGPPWPLWAVIFMTSSMVVGTVILYGVQKGAQHYPMVAIVSAIVAANLFLLLELSHPYIGAISTTSDPLEEVVRMLSQPVP